MSIVGEGENVYVEYHIPKDIKDRIPSYFYQALAGELFSVYGYEGGRSMFDASYIYDFDSGTNAWAMAFEMTCRKLNMLWLWEYYDALEWHDSDMFDGEIENGIIEHFIKDEDEHANCYYKYLCNKDKE